MLKPSPEAYRMQIASARRLTDPRCKDTVMAFELVMPTRAPVPAFVPGQVLRVAPEHGERAAYFAIASAPHERARYELFVKCQGQVASALCRLAPGDTVLVEGPMGRGFDLAPYEGMDVYLIGVGTGIAALRSVWRDLIPKRARFGRVAIYAGFLTPLHRLVTDELEALGEHDIEVSITIEIGHESWDGPIGYVQHQLEADRPDGRHAVACLSGMTAMVEACRETLTKLGFDGARILTNH